MTRTCFVVMPIRKTGTPEHAHFRAIFDQIKITIEKEGFSAVRADDVQKSGAITQDIVSRLAESELVVADLTDLNANVFYELGIRHALRGRGTIMIIDEKRTSAIPFDLGAYRVVKFTGDLTGIEPLKTALESFIRDAVGGDTSRRDNPVHDWFPMLPLNALEAASTSSVGPLRKTIKELEDRIEQYEKALGTHLPQKSKESSPLSLVMSAMSDAEDGLLPSTVLEAARKAFDERDVIGFLQKVHTIIERNVRLPSTAFIALAMYSTVLDLGDVARAIFEQALQLYPSDKNLKRSYLARLSHSETPSDRERARKEIAANLALEITGQEVVFRDPERLRRDLESVGLLLDACHRDGLDQEALRITNKMVEIFPNSTMVLRNHARALEQVGNVAKARVAFRAAILVPDVDDTSAIWLGNTLHNQKRNISAAEAYAFACLLDPTEATSFSHLADELSICLSLNPAGVAEGRTLPESIGADEVQSLAHCAASCPNVDAEVSQRVRTALERLELPVQPWDAPLSKSERMGRARHIYETLRSALTTPGSEYEFTSQ